MNFVFKKLSAFVINFLCSSLPIFILSPVAFYYLFSNDQVNMFVGAVVLINTSLLIPFFYFVLSILFINSQNPGERLMSIKLRSKNLAVVLKRVGAPVLFFYVCLFMNLSFLIIIYALVYPLFIVLNKNNKSLIDVLFKTEYFSSQNTKTPYNSRKGKD